MKSKAIKTHFENLQQQRDAFYYDSGIRFTDAWKRPLPEKWSVGETLYHLVLMVKLFRRFSYVYIPAMLPIAYIRRNKPYQIEIHNIYQEYQQKKKQPMNAPGLIKPPANLKDKWTIYEIQKLLARETDKLKSTIAPIKQDVAGHIYYPDPIAHYPNLIQSIHLLGIHEKHHFDIMKKYEALV